MGLGHTVEFTQVAPVPLQKQDGIYGFARAGISRKLTNPLNWKIGRQHGEGFHPNRRGA